VQQHGTRIAHGVPVTRLIRDGLRLDKLSHRRVMIEAAKTAYCMIGCPRRFGIHRGKQTKQIVIEDHCSRLRVVAQTNCPLATITMPNNEKRMSKSPIRRIRRKSSASPSASVDCDLATP